MTNYIPSPTGWVADQVKRIEESDGGEGMELRGLPVVLVTNRGRKTGATRKTPLMRVEHEGSYAVVASMGGAPKHPVWYLNAVAHPEVVLQDGPNVREMRAREVHGDEKALWWARALETWPAYRDYQEKTGRVIPVLVLEPTR